MQTAAILATTLLVSTSLAAQAKPSAAVPATLPTQSVSNLPSARVAANAQPHYNTRVTWDGARLAIQSNGEPMPEILGDVAHQTGMKITGGVPDEHLFGTYGPGSVQTVLAQLFDGLNINMLLVNGSATKPKELILTTRSGSPTPPSTRQIADTWQPRRTSEPIAPIAPQPDSQGQGNQPPQTAPNQRPTATTTLPAFPTLSAPPTENNSFSNTGNADSTPPATTDTSNSSTTQPESPNGVKTPEQIFEELRKRAAASQTKQ